VDHAIHELVLRFIDDPGGASFADLALQVFAHQFETCSAYRRFCERRGATPANVADWRQVPPVPIQAFKETELRCGSAERVFRSTGTTAGLERRSTHALPDLRLYQRSAVHGMRRFLFPDVERMRLASLIAPAEQQPESSLAQMVTWAFAEIGAADSAYAATAEAPDFAALVDSLRRSESDGEPLALLTTTGALIHFLDHARDRDLTFRLPHGSRLMDTGGGKGAPRAVSRKGLLHAVWNVFAIPGYFCVNEYGMAELSSQYYDSVIRDRVDGRHRPRHLAAPPWLRTAILDTATLQPVADGATGLICHYDLANTGTAFAVLSEDVGRVADGGLQLLGRAAGAEARGCSLSVAQWRDLSAASGAPSAT